MTNNFDLIYNQLEDDSEEQFYHLQILRRGKDHPELPAANRVIKAYFISGKQHLEKYREEIIGLCEYFGARAYINLAPKSMHRLATWALADLAKRIDMGDVKKIYKCFNTAAGEMKSKSPRWVIDIDDVSQFESIYNYLESEIYAVIPTNSGQHLITSPFNLQEFKQRFPNVDVHKNNPTVLYIPNLANHQYCLNKLQELFEHLPYLNTVTVAQIGRLNEAPYSIYINNKCLSDSVELKEEDKEWFNNWYNDIDWDRWYWQYELADANHLYPGQSICTIIDKYLIENHFDDVN